ncbi:DsrE family protein [Algoriphagus lutimaris]|uniref:DsrE family protein n=1 Tax=Algoriphagus lutimaris TaxID=613197 RepID=UPI00196B160E|nr:DsrE family protein [Algoriphagus lutimaris]MBN3519933.1 DsrE family protein [Algoriphagus lutimaris]
MKKSVLFLFGLILSMAVYAQTPPVKIVFDVTSGEEGVHQSAMRHISVMANQYPDSEFEMVVYSSALDMVLKDKSSVSKELEELAKKENVTFKVCQMSLDRYKLTTSSLIPGVGTVPDGILEIIKKQQEGWGYIKESK